MARRSKNEPSKAGSPAWMSTYGDMVTLLLCFFVLLFAMSTIDITKFKAIINSFDNNIDLMPGGQAIEVGELITSGISQLDILGFYLEQSDGEDFQDFDNRLENAREIANDIGEYLDEQNISDRVEITYSAQYIQLSLEGAILFDSGKAELKPDGAELIDIIGNVLKRYEDNEIAIEGHTDNVPMNTIQFPSNWHLSSARAITVANFLMTHKEFSPEKLFAVGYGEYRPIDDNSTVQGRAKNRRVEIKIINKLQK
ncbi:chemotaxis protein MotB [Natranaerovirga pectinivora]|uniref:Chemotaxis protein MotB n=1 Tax=Natranaerovirga pectinivora TaxID=682400 RepID=A0A4R3MQ63_9FIRM|nr:OmpA family protein [Natranaerovirga pectinivora]TCT16431.1 chemotaxis protein MotB [Natranaerovirga pectinivora]